MFTVNDIMTMHPHTLLPSNTLEEAKNLMQQYNIRHLPITDENSALCGIVTERDILAAQTSSVEKAANEKYQTILLEKIMNKNTISIDSHGGLKQAALFMQKHKVGCLPIVEQDKLIGIITDSDFVTIAINLLELQEEVDPLELDE